MSTTTPATTQISPHEVHEVLGRHMLVDGYRLVIDLERSHGARICSTPGASASSSTSSPASRPCPLGYNHPKLVAREFRERLLPAAVNKLANSDIYTTFLAEFVETFARTVPEPLRPHMFFVEGGALAVENALKTAFDWKVRRNLAAGKGEKGHQVLHFREAFHGRSGYTLSLTNTADPRKIQYFPKFAWPRISNPKLSFPITARGARAGGRRRAPGGGGDRGRAAPEPGRHRGADRRADPGRGRRQPLPRRVPARPARPRRRARVPAHLRRGAERLRHHRALVELRALRRRCPTSSRSARRPRCAASARRGRIDEVDSVFKVSSRINSTWGGNLVDMVRCQRIIEVIEEDGLLENATRVGERLLAGLRGLEAVFPGRVTNVRGRGMFVAFDLPDTETRNQALRALNEHGVLALTSGQSALRFRPPLTLDRRGGGRGRAADGKGAPDSPLGISGQRAPRARSWAGRSPPAGGSPARSRRAPRPAPGAPARAAGERRGARAPGAAWRPSRGRAPRPARDPPAARAPRRRAPPASRRRRRSSSRLPAPPRPAAPAAPPRRPPPAGAARRAERARPSAARAARAGSRRQTVKRRQRAQPIELPGALEGAGRPRLPRPLSEVAGLEPERRQARRGLRRRQGGARRGVRGRGARRQPRQPRAVERERGIEALGGLEMLAAALRVCGPHRQVVTRVGAGERQQEERRRHGIEHGRPAAAVFSLS